MRLPPLPSVSDVLRIYNIQCTKKLSQNMLIDSKLSSKIVRVGRRIKGNVVVEVGPGAGSLTRNIIEQGATHCAVIEKDARFLPSLNMIREAAGERLSIHLGDVLQFNMKNLFPPTMSFPWEDPRNPRIHIVGNLPFNIATPLLFKWLKQISLKENAWAHGRVTMVLTFQDEVAKRICAAPGDVDFWSRVSVMAQNWCNVEYSFKIPHTAFVPKPDVNVGVVYLSPLIQPVIDLDYDLVNRIVYTVFSARQKFCRNSIGYLFPQFRREELRDKVVAVADLNPMTPPFMLTVEEFNRVCHAYIAICEELPYLLEYNFRRGKRAEIEAIAAQNALENDHLERKASESFYLKQKLSPALISDY